MDTSRLLNNWRETWRAPVSFLVMSGIFVGLGLWSWHYRFTLQRIFVALAPIEVVGLGLLITGSLGLSAWSFTVLVRGLGYRFGYLDGYHSLNLSQIAAMLPGKIWGFGGLIGLLWSHGIARADGVLLILLYTLLSLSAMLIAGLLSLLPVLGWGYTLLCLLPVALCLGARSWLDRLRARWVPNSSALPSVSCLLTVLLLGLGGATVVCASFTVLAGATTDFGPVSPLLVASAFAAGYLGGFLSLIAPAGLGVREGVITLILGPSLGHDQILAVALIFRVIQMTVLWLHALITLGALAWKRSAVP